MKPITDKSPDRRVYILFSDDLLERVWARARAQGITAGEYVRRCVAAALDAAANGN